MVRSARGGAGASAAGTTGEGGGSRQAKQAFQQQQQQPGDAFALPDLESLLSSGMQVAAPHSRPSGSAGSAASSSGGASAKALWVVNPDGRVCIICQCRDSDADRVFTAECSMKWAYPPDSVSKRNRGHTCYYCLRVWQARFKGKYQSQEAFVRACGTDMQLWQVFNHWLNMAVELMKQHQDHAVTVKWGSQDEVRQLVTRQARETRIEDPEDQVFPLDDYIREHGDYRTNGLGHKYVDWGEVKGVLVPGKRIWRVKRARVMSAEIQSVVDSGEFQIGPQQLENLMEDIGGSFVPERATGVSLDSLLGDHDAPTQSPSKPVVGSGSAGAPPVVANPFASWPGLTMGPAAAPSVPVPGPVAAAPASKRARRAPQVALPSSMPVSVSTSPPSEGKGLI